MATRILVVEDDHNLLHFYNMVCENFNDSIEIIEATSGDQAIKMFQEDDNFSVDLIISDYKMEDGDGLKLYQFLRHRYSEIPFLVVSGNDNGAFTKNEQFARTSTNHYLPKPVREPDIRKILSLYIETSSSVDPDDISANFKKVNTVFFLRFQQTLCDIYIKLSDRKYVKLFHSEGSFNASDISRYLNKNIKHLYLTAEDYEKFQVSMAEMPFLEGIEQDEDENDSFETTQAVLSSLLQTYGISDALIKKGFTKIINTKNKINNSNELVELFEIRKESHSFYSDHSLMVALLASLTLDKMDWSSDENTEKLCMAAVLHDSVLEEEIVNIMESGNLEKFEFISDGQKDEYFAHPHKTAEMIRTKSKLHEDIATIIAEHHEKPDGSGFPRRLTYQNIHPLSSLFIVVHDFVEQLYLTGFAPELRSTILDNMDDKYTDGHFKSAYQKFLMVIGQQNRNELVSDEEENEFDSLESMDTMAS
jgi:response regulator RpfG family c-di-GMP phosphodiesterase